MRLHVVMIMALVSLVGCDGESPSVSSSSGGEPNDTWSSPSQLPDACRPDDPAGVQQVYGRTETSVHELITCGGIQLRLSLSIQLMIFASNGQLVSESARQDIREMAESIGLYVDNPFSQTADGDWSMAAGGSDGSTFSLRFFDPEGNTLVSDPFVLESYLQGVEASSSLTWDEMKADPNAKATITYAWQGLGPLSHLLAHGGTIPNPVVLELSLFDLGAGALGFAEPDLGPFDSLQDIQMESKVHMIDEQGGVEIGYDATGLRDSVRNGADQSSLRFGIDAIAATDGTYQLEGNTTDLTFLGVGQLAGTIQYAITGAGVDVRVISDFGGGAAYPEALWYCPNPA